jgi:hypothetical protein
VPKDGAQVRVPDAEPAGAGQGSTGLFADVGQQTPGQPREQVSAARGRGYHRIKDVTPEDSPS